MGRVQFIGGSPCQNLRFAAVLSPVMAGVTCHKDLASSDEKETQGIYPASLS